MTAAPGVLIVFDDCRVRDDSMRYALELAKRLDCHLSALVLPGAGAEDGTSARACLDAIRQAGSAEGVEVQPSVCDGDPASVLLKFLATHPPFRALVWGGDAVVVAAHPYGGGRHWFGRIRGQIRCPVVAAGAGARHRQNRLV
jgi:hypothetical protein